MNFTYDNRRRWTHVIMRLSIALSTSTAFAATSNDEPSSAELDEKRSFAKGQVELIEDREKLRSELDPAKSDESIRSKLTETAPSPAKEFKPYTAADFQTIIGKDGKTYVEAPGPNDKNTLIPIDVYLKQINDVEAGLALKGLSLRDDAPDAVLSSVPANAEERDRKRSEAIKAKLQEAEDFLKAQLDVKAMGEKLVGNAAADVRVQLEEVATKLGIDREQAQKMAFRKLSPEQMLKQNHDLYSLMSKNFRVEAGNEGSVALAAEADLSIKGDLKGLGALAAAWVEGTIFHQTGNIIYGGLYGDVGLDAEKGFTSGNRGTLIILGQEVKKWEKGEFAAVNDNQMPVLKRVVRVAKQYWYTIGPIPVSSEVGFQGEVNAAPQIEAQKTGLAIGISPDISLGGFMNAAVDYVIAKAGVQAELTFLEEKLTFFAYGRREVDPATSDKVLKFGVSGDSTMTALKGILKAYAKIELANLIKKKFETILFQYDGIVLSNAKLFNFEKIVSNRGVRFMGAPQNDDVAEVNTEEDLKIAFAEGDALAQEEKTESTITKMRQRRLSMQKNVEDTLAWMKQLEEEVQ